jgi:type IV pilus assembly protein PilO
MALIPENPRNRNLLVVAILVVGLGAVYQQLVWTPQNAENTLLSARLDTLDSLNRVAKLEVAKGTAAKMRREADEYGQQLNVLRRLVPTENEVPALLESISSAARRAGLEFSDVQPDGVVNGDQFDTYKYKLAVTGPYHQVAEFIANIGSLPRIVAPINVDLKPSNRASPDRRPKKNEQFLDVHFGIQTYVARPNQAAAPAGKAGMP